MADQSKKIVVDLHSIGLDPMRLEVDGACTFEELKRDAEGLTKIGAASMKLIAGTAVPNGNERLAAYCAQGEQQLVVTLVVSLDAVMQDLAHEDFHTRVTALGVIGAMGHKGGALAIEAATKLLRDPTSNVRQAAVRVLGAAAGSEQERQEVLELLLQCLDDEVSSVRRAVIVTLSEVATQGDETVMTAIASRLEHEKCSVRNSAVEGLAAVARKGDRFATEQVIQRLRHPDQPVRVTAASALGTAHWRDEADAIAQVIALLDEGAPYVRRAAIGALAGMLPNDTILPAVCNRLPDDDKTVRQMVVQFFKRCKAMVDVDGAFALLSSYLSHENANGRRAALDSLAMLVKPGTPSLRSLSLPLVEDVAPTVRAGALALLTSFVDAGDAAAHDAARRRVGDNSAEVRTAAISAFAGPVKRFEEDLVRMVLDCLTDPSPHVRVAAVKALSPVVKSTKGMQYREAVKDCLATLEPELRYSTGLVIGPV
eukprot:TRINITY_DN14351_c0_g2_i1.p1 TRINITY_DN14351_c0_g2~~TRINITY_DN14351_c0_g2_i1.p1  ORF type:complete len:566 (-),score=96.74 TRINITY_DN14351_c0_g2_i1:204-1655(-)